MELEALAKAAEDFEYQGAALVMISPQKVEHNREFGQEKNLNVPILSDPGNEIAARYGLRWTVPDELKRLYQKFGVDLPVFNGDDSWTLPLPARLIVDAKGIAQYVEISADYTIRPDPQDTLQALKQI